MKFKVFQLIINDEIPRKNDILEIAKKGNIHIPEGTNLFQIRSKLIENRFLWLNCQFDNASLYRDFVWNTEIQKNELNPRSKNQVEMRYQLFVCYDIEKMLLYLDNMKKRSFICEYIKHVLGKMVKIKNIIHSLDDFQNAVRYIKSAQFVQEKDLFNSNASSIFEQIPNIYGLDAPDKILLNVEYDRLDIRWAFESLKNLGRKAKQGEFKRIIIVGEDDEGIEKSFDFSSLIESVEVDVNKNENGYYSEKLVEEGLLSRIR